MIIVVFIGDFVGLIKFSDIVCVESFVVFDVVV